MSVFVDTSAWFASMVPSDPKHLAVLGWLKSNPLPLVTTDYIIDETLTLLRARGEFDRAVTMGREFFEHDIANVVPVSAAYLRRAWKLFSEQPQRRWSFTDCTSKVIMDARHMKKALTFDAHFHEFGPIQLVV